MSATVLQTDRFLDMIMHVAAPAPAGGHIYDEQRRGSLCGVEKRFPFIESEQGLNEPFAEWLKENESWVCRRCLTSYRRLTRSAAVA